MSTLRGDEPDLQLGDSGEHVTQLQDRLRGLGYLDSHPHGSYDDATQSAVRQFQSDRGLDNDGMMTSATWQELDSHMIGQGLHYNHAAGAANQHWDNPQGSNPQDAEAADPNGPQWDGQQWVQYDSQTGQWVPLPADQAGQTDPGAATAAAAHPVPHIDNVHPGVRDDPRFATFHDFMRQTHGS